MLSKTITLTITFSLFTILLHAQDLYPPGTVQMTPEIDLSLKPVELQVPEKFTGLVPGGKIVYLPEGFSAKVFAAEGLRGPRMMAFNKDGVLHVANMKAGESSEFRPEGDFSSQIIALPDEDKDGVADTVIVAADDLWWANSLVFYEGDMYVADVHQIVKFTDADNDLVYEGREVFVDDIPTKDRPHMTRTLAVNDSTGHFYLSIGSFCDVCRDQPEHAAVLQFNDDGTERRVFASGIRNAIGLDIHPLSGELWATNNGHTEVENHLPPEWIDIVRDGGFYGWPFAYAYQVWTNFDHRNHDRVLPITAEDTLLVETMQRPAALVDAHVAPMDIHFYPSGNFPEKYHNAAFMAYRAGALGPDPGHKVAALFVNPDGSNAQVADFMTGFWPNPPDQDNIWGKLVGIASDSDGALYISSDWINHFVLKVEYQQPTTGINDDDSNILPQTAILEQNYPNPFNPTTQINFSLPENNIVKLEVFNLLGQRVSQLVNEMKAAGRYEITFDASDLPSGIYFYRIEAGSFVDTKKLILIK